MCKAGDKNVNIFSNPLDNVLGHTLAFKVRVQPKYKNSFVQKISDDPTVMRVILDFLSNEEVLKLLTPYTIVLKSFPLKFTAILILLHVTPNYIYISSFMLFSQF